MILTNAAIFRLASASDEQKAKIYNSGIDYAAVIKKAKSILLFPQSKETIESLDSLIGECSLPAAKLIHKDAMQFE